MSEMEISYMGWFDINRIFSKIGELSAFYRFCVYVYISKIVRKFSENIMHRRSCVYREAKIGCIFFL